MKFHFLFGNQICPGVKTQRAQVNCGRNPEIYARVPMVLKMLLYKYIYI